MMRFELLDESGEHARQAGRLRLSASLAFLCRQGAQQILATYDANDLAVTNYRRPFDAMCLKQASNLADIGVLVDGYHRPCHDILCGPLGTMHAGKELGAERFAFRQQREPPILSRLALCFVSAEEIALAYHADGTAGLTKDRNRANVVCKHKPSDISGSRFRTH
jgi:hypothetical protein